MLLALLLVLAQDAPVRIPVVDRDPSAPIFARVVLQDRSGGVIGSTAYKTLNGHFVAPEGWSVTLPKIANPLYFGPPPTAATASGKGRVTRGGRGVPAEIVVTVRDKEVSRATTSPDGTYGLADVPLAAHLVLPHGGASLDRNLLHHDPRLAELHRRIGSAAFAGKPDSLGDAFPPDFFRALRDLARDVTVDADLPK